MAFKKTKRNRILWAVDLSENGDIQFLERTGSALQSWSNGSGAVEIEPVFILRPGQFSLPNAAAPLNREAFVKKQQALLSSMFRKSIQVNILPLRVISLKGVSQSAVSALLAHAKKSRCSAIVLSTHARKGLPRFFLGSFVETALLSSRIPLLVVNPAYAPTDSIRRILFATDLSKNSSAALGSVIAAAKERKAGLIILHVSNFMRDNVAASFGPAAIYYENRRKDLEARKRILKKMAEKARKSGIAAHGILLPESQDIAGTIAMVAKRQRAQVIAMVSRCNPTEAIFAGSVTRNVIRAAREMVWTVHIG